MNFKKILLFIVLFVIISAVLPTIPHKECVELPVFNCSFELQKFAEVGVFPTDRLGIILGLVINSSISSIIIYILFRLKTKHAKS